MSDILSPSSDAAKLLLDRGFNPSGNELSKKEALGWAIERGHIRLVQLLVDEGADVNAKDDQQIAPLHKAARKGSCDILSILNDANASISVGDKNGYTALHYASAWGQCDAIRFLVNLGADLESRDAAKCTPLHWAARQGQCPVIQLLYDLKADIRSRDQNDWAPIHTAARNGQLKAMQLLIELGSDVGWRASTGLTVCHMAARNGSSAILEYLANIGGNLLMEQDDIGRTALHWAVESNEHGVVEVLLRHNVDVERKNNTGHTALAVAAYNGNTEIVRLLAEHNANLNPMNLEGYGPIHHAAAQDHEETMQYLIENGVDIEARNFSKMTPLHIASRAGNRIAARFLVDRGANIEARGHDNYTVLHYATGANDKLLVRFFVKRGCDVEAKTDYGQTALSLAAGLGYKEIILFLLDSGASVATTAKELWTPLHYAAYYGHKAAVEVLLEHGADPTAKTKKGDRAQTLATAQGHKKTSDLLREKIPVSQKALGDLESQLVTMLVSAAAKGNAAEVTRLIGEGVEVDSVDLNGRRALSVAAENGRGLVVDLLIENKANPDLQDVNGESPLWWAARYGHEDIVRTLLAQDIRVDAADSDGQTPLSVAAQMGFAGIVGCLLKKGSSPNSTVSYGKAALHFAAAGGHYRAVELLIKYGADVDHVSPEDDTALSLADAHGHEDISALLRRHCALQVASESSAKHQKDLLDAAANGRVAEIDRLAMMGVKVNGVDATDIPIIWAACKGQDAATSALIKHGATVDIQDSLGRTPIAYAAGWGHTSTVKLLHQEGSKIDSQDNKKRTPLSFASETGHESVVRLLLDMGAKKEIKDHESKTALWHAVAQEHMAVVKALLEKGANVESADAWGYTPLAQAVRLGNRPLAAFLLEKGAKMRPESATNRSPLCLASAIGSESLVELLIDHGADLNHLSDGCETPISIAAREGHSMVIKILIEMGADIHLRNDSGRTALSYAKELGYEPVVKLLSQAATLRQTNNLAMRKAEQKGLNQRKLYKYRPLKQEGYIRILELDPGKKGDIISFELYDVDLNKNPAFEALSYEWKEKFGSIPVQCGRDRLLVTPNCKSALERMRHETDRRSLWIDAVCINQEDKHECNKQVAMMTEIYRKARSVLMWIGEEDSSTEAAFNRIPTLCQLHEILLKDPNGSSWEHYSVEEREDARAIVREVRKDEDAITGLRSMLFSQYFTRAWIFQEIILAGSRGLVMCGRHRCPWKTFKAALLGFVLCASARCPPFYEIVQCDDTLLQSGALDLSRTSVAMTEFEASDARDKIFATLRLASVRSASIKRPVADYTLTVQEVYVNATRYFIDIYQGVEVWNIGHRSSTKTIQDLPTWASDFTRPREDLYINPFPEPPAYSKFVQGRPTTTPTSLYIDGCLIDQVVCRVCITREKDVYGIVKPMVRALAKHGRSVYDPYLDHTPSRRVGTKAYTGRIGAKRVSFPKHAVPRRSRKNPHNGPQKTTNGHAILDTIMNKVEGYDSEQVAAYLAWKISTDDNTPPCSKEAPNYLQTSVANWQRRSRARADFDLDICRSMEDKLTYDRDLVYTARGYLGLTNQGEAQEGLWVALVGGAHFPVLLREKKDEQSVWYEFVDRIFLNHLTHTIEKLEDMHGDTRVRRLEIR